MQSNKSQVIRDSIYVAATAVGTVATVYLIWRIAAGPDAQREFVMSYYQHARNHAKQRAEYWGSLAEKYGDLYINAGMAGK